MNKYLIAENTFLMGDVEFHKELLTDIKHNVKGGGKFHIDTENKIMYLYDTSADFGKTTKEDIVKAIREGKKPKPFQVMSGFKIIFSTSYRLDLVMDKGELIIESI